MTQVGGLDNTPDFRLLVVYLVCRNMEEGVSVSGLNKKLAGLAFWFKLNGKQDFTKEFWVRQAVKRYRRGVQRKDDRRPVSFELLGRLFAQLSETYSSRYEMRLFRTAFALVLFGAFRIGELVSPSKKEKEGIGMEEVICGADGLSMRVRKSKMDQEEKGKWVMVFAIPGSPLCPVSTVKSFLEIRPGGMGSFLIHENGESLSRFQFISVFSKCLKALGLGGLKFSSHSFRIGEATKAVRWGLDEDSVKRIGRWESRRFRSYVWPELLEMYRMGG